jgi:hypothetical protein
MEALGRLRQEDQEFKASLSYVVSSRPAWATGQHVVLKNKTNKKGDIFDNMKLKFLYGKEHPE